MNIITRRQFLRTAAAGGVLGAASASAKAEESSAPRSPLLAQDYVVVTKVPDSRHFVHDPGMTILPNRHLVAAAPIWRRPPSTRDVNKYVAVCRSVDAGRTWTELCRLPYAETALFPHEGKLYMLTQRETWQGVWVTVSEDEGHTWADGVEVIRGAPDRQHWNLQAGMVVKDGWLYWANGKAYQDMGAVACELDKGLMNPAAWRASNVVVMPIPNELVSERFTDGATMRCLEGNVVEVGGRLMVIARAVINRYGTANMAAVFNLRNEPETLDLSFKQLYPLPGGQCKFYILYDAPSRLFWMASNLPTNSQDLIHAAHTYPHAYPQGGHSLREDRRNLVLSYSLDALNWFPAGWIAKARKLTQSFMYPSMVVDGDDLALLSRSGVNSGDYHDADMATFHRIRNFRSLALDISPQM
jgi:hypothetical protein